MVVWAGLGALLVNALFAVANIGNWDHLFVFNARRKGEGGGILYELHLALAFSAPAMDLLSATLVLAVVALLVPRVLQGSFPVAAAAITFVVLLLANKVCSPQYMLSLFVFGVMTEWPMWSLVLMSVAGLVDYADAMMVLYRSHTHIPAFSWFFRTLYPWNRALRYGSIVFVLLTSLVKGCQAPSVAALLPVAGQHATTTSGP